ncbi:MAG: phosphoribosylformylglycinamidine synthase, partial [Deltaproteobacteria bacterium]|nr:phosphoribosylformylglycinamidine synthase [Deltaproteobacteria bacterium]
GPYGEKHKVSGLPTLQFTATGVIDDVMRCQTMEFKAPGDLIYVLGVTRNELGGSEYYDLFGYLGLNVPQTDLAANRSLYEAFSRAYREGLIASARGLYRGGLGVHLALASLGGGLGADVDLDRLVVDTELGRRPGG